MRLGALMQQQLQKLRYGRAALARQRYLLAATCCDRDAIGMSGFLWAGGV